MSTSLIATRLTLMIILSSSDLTLSFLYSLPPHLCIVWNVQVLEPVFQRLIILTLMRIMLLVINEDNNQGSMCTTNDNKYLSSIASGVSSAARIPQPGRHIDLIVDFIDGDNDIP